MACQTAKWLYGLLPLAALWVGVNLLETGPIEADLASRARSALARGAAGTVDPQLSGRDVTLKGVIADSGARVAALAGVAAVSGVRKVADSLTERPPVAQAAGLVAAAASAGLASEAALVPSAPPAGVRAGKAHAFGPAVAPAYGFYAEKSKGKLTLAGFYPDAESHAALLAAAAKNFPGLGVIDQMLPGDGAPRDYGEAVLAGLENLARLREGALDLSDHSARLSGEAATTDIADEIRAGLVGSLPGGFAVDARLTAPARVQPAPEANAAGASVVAPPLDPPPVLKSVPPTEAAACQARLAALLKDRPIQFASSSARILPESATTLAALAEAAKTCPMVSFEISGHTDDVGPVSRNDNMSRRRAENVLVYLVDAGVDPQRLRAAGYGERRPLVPNDNDENRAKNRRIEFNLK